ncbi:MAG: helix-turn-helix transcriptional regulator, partial [Pseudomonadota bacterium]
MSDVTGAAPVFLTTAEVAELLRLKERKVYDLAASGQLPCSKATGKLLFPRAEIMAWLQAHRQGPAVSLDAAHVSRDLTAAPRPPAPRPPVFLGSHDPLLDWALRESRCGLATFFDGSADGLERFVAGEGIATGLHLYEPDTGAWNVPQVTAACHSADAVLIGWAQRQRGLLVSRAQAGRITSLSDLDGLRLAPRQPEAGTQHLFQALM